MSQSSDVILSYYDSLLRQKDVELLRGPHWINDNIIGFYFEYLNMQKTKEYSLSQSVLFVCPEVTQLVKLSFDITYSVFLSPLKIKEKMFIFFPLNDSKSKSQAGGSHWTLLVYSGFEKTFYHFDSAGISDQTEIKEFTKNLNKYLLKDATADYVEVDCPQQSNGVDCGLFVICFAEILLKHVWQHSKIKDCDLSPVTDMVSKKRADLLDLINNLIELDHAISS